MVNVLGSLKFQKIRLDNVRHRKFMAISQNDLAQLCCSRKNHDDYHKTSSFYAKAPNIPEHHFSYSHLPNKREEKENFDRF